MSLRAYGEIYLHLTWHVKNSAAILMDEIEAQTHRFLRGRVLDSPGAFFHEIGGTDNHVHLVVSMPSTILLSTWIGQLKGSSSHFINNKIANRKVLEWQDGYGFASFSEKGLPWVVDYVRNQREHHASGRTVDRLERTEPPEEQMGQGPQKE
jgi:putative transposase